MKGHRNRYKRWSKAHFEAFKIMVHFSYYMKIAPRRAKPSNRKDKLFVWIFVLMITDVVDQGCFPTQKTTTTVLVLKTWFHKRWPLLIVTLKEQQINQNEMGKDTVPIEYIQREWLNYLYTEMSFRNWHSRVYSVVTPELA